jgi:hypothetical protein
MKCKIAPSSHNPGHRDALATIADAGRRSPCGGLLTFPLSDGDGKDAQKRKIAIWSIRIPASTRLSPSP